MENPNNESSNNKNIDGSEIIKEYFLLELFDIKTDNNNFYISFSIKAEHHISVVNYISSVKIPFVMTKIEEDKNNYIYNFKIEGTNCIDFLGILYPEGYRNISIYSHIRRLLNDTTDYLFFNYMKTDEKAIPPSKNKMSDSGHDLHLLKVHSKKGNVTYYDTGIAVKPMKGYYFDLVGRSSIAKSGYMLANNIGIIDASYRGSIIVALVKIDPEAPELELPAKMVQLIPRKLYIMDPIEVDQLDSTKRGDSGGLGSGSL